jgi:hypothetical protein
MYLDPAAVLAQHGLNADGQGVGSLLKYAEGYGWLDNTLEFICASFRPDVSICSGVLMTGLNRGFSGGPRGNSGLLVCMARPTYW